MMILVCPECGSINCKPDPDEERDFVCVDCDYQFDLLDAELQQYAPVTI